MEDKNYNNNNFLKSKNFLEIVELGTYLADLKSITSVLIISMNLFINT